MSDIARYVVTIIFHEQTLTEVNELTNHLTRAGFTLTLTDDEGKVHEPGTNSFGLLSPQSEDEIRALAARLAEAALHRQPEITLVTFEHWLRENRAE